MPTNQVPPAPLRTTEISRLPAYRAADPPAKHADGLLDLANNELTLPPLPAVVESLRLSARSVHLYPDPTARTLRQAVARHFATDPEEIVVGPGSGAVLHQLLLALCGPGDEVLYPWPGFDAYPFLITTAGAQGTPVPLTPSGEHDLSAFAAKVDTRTRIVVLCSPHNPTGRRIPRTELAAFLGSLPPHVVTVLDQAYVEFDEHEETHNLDLLRTAPRLVLLRTFSKAYGLAGLRAGYALAAPDLAGLAYKTLLPFSVTRTAEHAAQVSLEQHGQLAARLDTVRRGRSLLSAGLRAEGLDPLPSFGNFLWLPLGAATERFAQVTLAAGVRVRAYPGAGVRITVGGDEAHRRVLDAARLFRTADT
ncbi:aminotransferase class I/II-fold pyridoxal phosphate-dependent enzyme [Streptomyces sp. FXJ1.172]|uniref:aminotransferase class I/II-fold pyridoxal phosphate-dependent enzyme n=1 Tax=Streptomyces sp. FXJ1.172 TaxID=710705 RepID=UPI00078CD00A|nr:aminotransferase class I/II-fold pyridoxal phosphate-dependent enzyme [Streptomyces sp. FXJ1.172]AMR44310.1 aminotransferase [Streptomyces sp. FXJ1.172]WEO92677.1 aminotransferase class I/II-fold pyridoxal phosphate-dependent enzyme [Streptomyces sp. FXJ1.172]